MPMGGKNAPSVFQRLMDRIFHVIPREQLVVYLDDMLCHSKTEDENIQQLEQVLQILISNNLKIRATKTEVLMPQIQFCGYIIGNGTKKPNPKKVEAVEQLKIPNSKAEAQSLFGLLNYHRHFINRFSAKAAPITDTYKGSFKWTDEATKSLDILKQNICKSALELRIPDVKNSTFIMETDASNEGYGACLYICTSQQDGHTHNPKCLRPMEYASRQFTAPQKNYSTMEKELLAGREALRKWSHFLLGRPFVWRTDNACLKWAHRVRSQKLKISQWLAEISEYDVEIERRPSASMKISDCLSRSFAEINSLRISKRDLAELQQNDEILQEVRQYVQRNRWPNNPSPEIRPFLRERSRLVFGSTGELLFNDGQFVKTIPPASIQEDIIKAFHDKNGHPGEKQTIGQLQNNYYWPELITHVKKYIRCCHDCQITKPNLHPKQPPLGESETPSKPWEIISWDLIGPLPITETGNRFVLTGFDLFSKRVYGVNLQTKASIVVGTAIKRILLQHPNMPRVILTDNGTEFSELDHLCQQYNMKHNLSAPYHPQANGGVERANQTLKNRLFSAGHKDTWDQRLDDILHSMNCSVHAVTKLTPFAIETGYNGQNINDFVSHSNVDRQNVRQYNEVVKTRILEEKQKRVNKFRKDNFVPFNIGDLVLARNMNKTDKFPRFFGPSRIIEVRGSGLSYVIQNQQNGQTFTRYVTQLKPYTNRNRFPTPNIPTTPQPPSGRSNPLPFQITRATTPESEPNTSNAETHVNSNTESPAETVQKRKTNLKSVCVCNFFK